MQLLVDLLKLKYLKGQIWFAQKHFITMLI